MLLLLVAIAAALPVIALYKVLSGFIDLGYAPYLAYSIAMTVLLLVALAKTKDIMFSNGIEGRALIYLAILASMVVIFGIY